MAKDKEVKSELVDAPEVQDAPVVKKAPVVEEVVAEEVPSPGHSTRAFRG
jgi:hypothetical protein